MNTQQIHDYYVEPALKALGKSFNHANARFLILCTLAVESDMGEFILQVGKNNISKIDIDRINDQIDNGKINIGLGIGQLESKTIKSIFCYSDNIQKPKIKKATKRKNKPSESPEEQQIFSNSELVSHFALQYDLGVCKVNMRNARDISRCFTYIAEQVIRT